MKFHLLLYLIWIKILMLKKRENRGVITFSLFWYLIGADVQMENDWQIESCWYIVNILLLLIFMVDRWRFSDWMIGSWWTFLSCDDNEWPWLHPHHITEPRGMIYIVYSHIVYNNNNVDDPWKYRQQSMSWHSPLHTRKRSKIQVYIWLFLKLFQLSIVLLLFG